MNQVCTCLSKNNIAINLLFSSKVAAGAIYYFFFLSSMTTGFDSSSKFAAISFNFPFSWPLVSLN